MKIESFFDKNTATFSYIVIDESKNECAIIDSVLDFDIVSGKISTNSADNLIKFIQENNLKCTWILETHIHADHLTAADYIKEKIGAKTAISKKIIDVLKYWVPIFDTLNDTPLDGSQFDHLFEDKEEFKIGNLIVKVIQTPGHTPSCVSYLIEDAIFVGDALLPPKIGTARVDFPGGSAEILYDSIQKILSLPDNVRIFTCHDYPENNQKESSISTVLEQKETNILINENVNKQDYIKTRNQKDSGKTLPKLLLPSIQVNLRAGNLGKSSNNGIKYIKIPLNQF